MADKDFLLITKARELLLYTRVATKPVVSDVAVGDVQKVLHSIAELDDLDKVREACINTSAYLRKRKKYGFSKRSFRDFGEEMRDISKNILRGILAANGVTFSEAPEERMKLIDGVLSDTSLLLEYINICKESDIISAKTAGIWSGKAVEVKRMAAAWRKSSDQRAEKILASKRDAADRHTAEIIRRVLSEERAKSLKDTRGGG